ncbi:hypothetical protein BsWGS_07141 [Bradybaena similaris]
MSKASDPRLAELTKKRPSSAPRPGEITDIPTIILSDRKEPPSLLSTSLSSSVHFGVPSSPEVSEGDIKDSSRSGSGVGQSVHVTSAHMGVRSSSDIGLPATSMPNLAVRLVPGGDMTTAENYLEVFCSPRTFRRSVDLDSKDHTRGQFEWVDTMDSSTNCLKVLTSSSRVGSALSLNSECTARSIGLLSNDSDSDNDLSLTESEKVSLKPSQLRRFMSYSEDSVSHDVCARPSQSMSDLKTTEKTNAAKDAVLLVPEAVEESIEKSDAVSQDRKPEENNGEKVLDDRASSPCDVRLQEKIIRAHKKEICRDRSRSGTTRPSHMLSYKCDIHDSTRDCRIRQWLQDMDSQE